jgi:hypothetical protein
MAAEIDVRPSAIYHWVRGATAPRPAHASIIQRLARERGIRLTLDEIYRHSCELRAIETKLGMEEPPVSAHVRCVERDDREDSQRPQVGTRRRDVSARCTAKRST